MTRLMDPLRVHITAYGCQMNRLDADLVAEVLRAAGSQIVSDADDADVLLYLTCAVRGHAEDRVFSNLGALAARKRRQPDLVVGLLGCMAQEHGEGALVRAPVLNLVCAPGRLAELPALVAAARAGGRPVALDPCRGTADAAAFGDSDADLDRLAIGRPPAGEWPGHAYVVAMRGCDNFCAYCVVPYVRGPERSRAPDDILAEVRRLVDGGVREVTLLGQAVNRYRAVSGGRPYDLADLLAAVADVPGLVRLRFVTSHPGAMTPHLAQAFRDVPRVCPHLHMPAQAGSDAVLARMNRGYTAAEYADRVAMVREVAPDVAVVSDFIVGFCGETDADFEATVDLARRLRFAAGFVFKYSPRPGTVAARQFPDDVPTAEKRRRHQVLSDTLAAIAAEENRRLVGRRVRVMIEGASPRPNLNQTGPGRCRRPGWQQLRGRTPCHRLVVLDGPPQRIGHEVEADLVDAGALTLFASLAETEGAEGA